MSRAQEMRAAFDRSFAEPPLTEQAPLQDFLAIRVGTDPYAIRLTDIRGLFADRPVTLLPSDDSAFLGIAGVRGIVVPVYDLGALLGHPPGALRRWLLLIGAASLALAFEAFEGHLRLPQAALAAQGRQERSGAFVQEVLHTGNSTRAIVQITAIFDAIEQGARQRSHHQES
ncbi:MAG: chemotaxis protein CheW [Steroidobacteraceae bacterium]